MTEKGRFILNIVSGVVVALFFSWIMIRSVRRSTDLKVMIFKLVLSGLIVLFLVTVSFPMMNKQGMSPMGGLALSLVCFFVMAATWRHDIIELIEKPFGALYDGGGRELEARPFYSIARAKQKLGKYAEAIQLVREQLERFPSDVEGQMLIAEIQAEGENDLSAAAVTVQRLCSQKGHSPNQIIFALNSLADWQLKYAQDVESARQNLERIIERFPGSEFALAATQRIAHLSESHQVMMDRHDHRRIFVTEGVQNMGLASAEAQFKVPEVPPEQQAADCVKQLEKHPLDMETRERLAMIYANHYQRLDLATDQLEQMIKTPGQPPKSVVRWLNLLADQQIKLSGDFEMVKRTLERIIEISPDVAAANMARTRISYLKLQLKGKHETGSGVKLGTYDQDIGLKG